MDLTKALDVSCLCNERHALIEKINDFQTTVDRCRGDERALNAYTTVMVPVRWLPDIIKIAEERLEVIYEEIDKL